MTDAPLPTPATTVYLERLLPATVAEVFAAWTDPTLMAKWLAPTGYAEVETDLRVGGQFRVTMIGDDVRLEHSGEYLLIDPPRRLSFTWRSPYTGGMPVRSTSSLRLVAQRPSSFCRTSNSQTRRGRHTRVVG
jgi:uncharacterized protein YndB with AHSA1/START domain